MGEDPEESEVFLVDLGREECVKHSHLCRLDKSFSREPERAVLCRLAGVEPVGGGAARLEELLSGAALTALPTSPHGPGPLLVELRMEEAWETVSQLLLRRGLATASQARGGAGRCYPG
jgi:hypothetical protein